MPALAAEESMSERLITLIGGSGFIGRHLVRRLAAKGYRIRVGVRRPEKAKFLQPLGDVGQIVPVQVNLRDDTSVLAAVTGSSAVVNLVGVLRNSGHQTFNALHGEGPGRVGRLAALAGVDRLIHLSAIGASPESASRYAQSKAAGEAALKDEFPSATIIRPSLVFGPDDQLFNRFGALAAISPVLPLFGDSFAAAGATKFQPVFVGDVAAAIAQSLNDEATVGKTYEIGGPRIYSFRQLMELVLEYTGRRRLLVPVPFSIAGVGAAFMEFVPQAPVTRDQLKLLRIDNVCGAVPGLAELNVEATPLEAVLPGFLARFRKGGRPVEA
jgi:NADH dehydrogenase